MYKLKTKEHIIDRGGQYVVPFKTPSEYWVKVLKQDYKNLPRFREILHSEFPDWLSKYDCDLHVYPYTKAEPGFLSVGCNYKCHYCPTAIYHQGHIEFGDYEVIIPQYKDKVVHFMDENFFMNDLDKALPLLKANNIIWLCMSTYKETLATFDKYGEDYLYDCGLRVVEIGLENVALYRKVKEPIKTNKIEIYYLQMTFFPGETKETIIENAEFMKQCSLKRPIHYNNSLWYAPGQYLYPYQEDNLPGIMIPNKFARTTPTFIPNSFLEQNFKIVDLEKTNWYNQLVYNWKCYPEEKEYNVAEFIDNDYRKAQWLVVGIRVGGII